MASLLTVDRALQALEAFTRESPEWGVSELARAAGLDKSQVQRILATLSGRGFLAVDPLTRRYRLGPRLVALGRLAEQTSLARPLLSGLARRCQESAMFNEPDGAYYRCAAAVDGPGPLRYAPIVGERFPGYGGGASGDAIFAHLLPPHVRELFGDQPRRTDGTAGETWDQLEKRYAQIRREGIAMSYGDYDPRVAAVAAPVLAQGAVLGSVAVLGPRDEMREAIEPVSDAVREVATLLGRLYNSGPE